MHTHHERSAWLLCAVLKTNSSAVQDTYYVSMLNCSCYQMLSPLFWYIQCHVMHSYSNRLHAKAKCTVAFDVNWLTPFLLHDRPWLTCLLKVGLLACKLCICWPAGYGYTCMDTIWRGHSKAKLTSVFNQIFIFRVAVLKLVQVLTWKTKQGRWSSLNLQFHINPSLVLQ